MHKFALALLLLLIINHPSSAEIGIPNYTVKKTSRLGPIPTPKGEIAFSVFNDKAEPVIYFIEIPYKDITGHCNETTDSENHFFPLYPRIFLLPCPARTLLAKNAKEIIWKFPLDDYEGEPIGYSPNGIILHSFAKAKLDILSFESGKIAQSIPSTLIQCKEYPRAGYYDNANNELYIFCKEGVLKKLNIKTSALETIYEPKPQFLTNVSVDISNIKLDSSGRFLIFSQTMPSRVNSWGGVAVYDLLKKQEVYHEKIYPWSWHVDVSVGSNRDFALIYNCTDDNAKKTCGNYYQILPE